MYRIYDHGTGRFIAETTNADTLQALIESHAGRPVRHTHSFWVNLATKRLAQVAPANDGYTRLDVRLEAF